MRVITSVVEMQRFADELRASGKRIGLVPTMGYLHEGHLSLVDAAKKNADVVVMSVYVNPTQFAPTEDFASYPRDMERDLRLAEARGVDLVFAPSDKEMYPAEQPTFVVPEKVGQTLEGEFRPTHFRGVTTVVAKLFNIVKPHVAVFGQKDAQQAFIIGEMVRGLNFDIEVVVSPIVREEDGLAMSSRNVYLSAEERRQATVLYRSLKLAETMVEKGEEQLAQVRAGMVDLIKTDSKGEIDYISFVDPDTFERIEKTGSLERVLALLAVRFGKTRLIDNMYLDVSKRS